MDRVMKIMAVAVAVTAALLSFPFDSDAKNPKRKDKWETVVFATSMYCEQCVKKMEANLPFEKGVKDLVVSLEDKTVTFKFDPLKTDKNKLAGAIVRLGYEAVEILPEEQGGEDDGNGGGKKQLQERSV